MTSLAAVPLVLMLAAAQEAPPDPEATVREFVPLLSDATLRSRAVDRLAHAGPAALPLLEKSALDADTLGFLRDSIRLQQALGAAYAPPRRFTFDGKEESLGNLLSRLETASGVTFHKHAVDLGSRHALALREASFWETLDALGRKVPFTYQPYIGDQLYLNAGPPPDKPLCYYGPFRLSLDRVLLHRRIAFDRTTEELTARLHVLWENHVSPLGLNRRFRIDRAQDDTGATLLLPSPEGAPAAEPARPLPTANRLTYEVLDLGPLRPLSAAARRLAILEGTVEVDFPSRVDRLVFEKPAEKASLSREIEGATVELRNCSPGGPGGLVAEFVLRFKDEKEAAGFRAGARDVSIVPVAGAPQPVQIVESRVEKNVVTFSARAYRVGLAREIKEIVLRVPRGIHAMRVPFRYRDVELR